MLKPLLLSCLAASALVGCGTLTGIPSHGGGKRFAVEQELVSASARASVKDMDLSALQGKKVALYISTIGDQGSGNIAGGRYSLDALIRGEYLNTPNSVTDYAYPNYTTTASTNAGTINSTTTSQSVLNAPSQSINQSRGEHGQGRIGIATQGMGEFRNETLITNPRDVSFLHNLIQTMFFLRDIDVVSPEYADTDVFITVDVFGTIRSRTELHIHNRETLQAVTKLEYFAVDRASRKLLIKPTTSNFESQYQERYALWMGPYKKDKSLQQSDRLMVDFSDVVPYDSAWAMSAPSFTPQEADDEVIVHPDVLRQNSQD